LYDHTRHVYPVHAFAWKAIERKAALAVPAVHTERHSPEGSPVNSGHCSEQKELESTGGRLWLLQTTAMSECVIIVSLIPNKYSRKICG